MNSNLFRYIFSFIFLILLQSFVLNNVQLSGYLNPYLYILFILSLPFDTSKYTLLLLSFLLGLCIDFFLGTTGVHASASVFMAFCRPFILRVIAPREGYDTATRPRLQDMGVKWFIIYAFTLTLLHHLFLFYTEVFRFSHFFTTLGRSISSTLFTFILIFISQLFIFKKADSKS
ncbi:MAG: rod shape-determining protein MreD [Bacteroidetes bacterium]|nr:rod shape-determining protein MreD [Bacteroidota bacterium]NOG95883.1 rod shape-determining protein MreD [Bacteroidota bacterium]